MPFICLIRTDIPDGILQVLDLRPNTSQRNLIYEPPGQTKYINRVQNSTLAALAANATVATYKGVAAYLIDNVIDNVSGVTITVTVANAAAVALIAAMDTGTTDLDIASVNAILVAAGAGAGTTLATAPCTGTLLELLGVLGGREYTLPIGSVVGALAAPLQGGSFTSGQYRHTYDSGALNISYGEGDLSEFVAATFEYVGVTGAALVVFEDDGTVMV